MALIKAKEWIEKTFAIGSQPKIETVKHWIEIEQINGKIINGKCYVEDSAAFVAPIKKAKNNVNPIDESKEVIRRELVSMGLLRP